jgi:hypothetical protein
MKDDQKDRACSTHGKMRNEYKSLVGKSERKRPLGTPIRRWDINIKMDIKIVIMWTEFIYLTVEKVANSCEHCDEPSGSIKCGNFLTR